VDGHGQFVFAAPALRGHADSVRRVAAVPEALAAAGGALLSASHDGSARLWSATGDCLAEYLGHTALVYAVAGGAHLVATGSEDDTARVWPAGGGVAAAALRHPGCVWDVAWLPGGQLLTACADGRARVWTPLANQADPALGAALDAALTARAIAASAPAPGAPRTDAALAALLPPGVKLEEPSALSRPGAKDGATKVVREANGAAMAYSWDAAAGRWEQIGEVVGADGSGLGSGGAGGGGGSLGVGGRVLDGVSYDFVFDVDVADGAPPRKLPYNAGDNPYDAAEKWLEREGLPASYREQIVAFIIQNTVSKQALRHGCFCACAGSE
jgi:phospholipase A-2-activating protein